MRRRYKWTIGIIVLMGIVLLSVWAFIEGRREVAMEQERERPVNAPLRVSYKDNEAVITLDKETVERSGIAVSVFKQIFHRAEVRAYGMVEDVQDLIDLRNGYITAKAQLEKSEAVLEASRREYERLEALNKDNKTISDKNLQAAKALYLSDRSGVLSANEALLVMEYKIQQQWGKGVSEALLGNSSLIDRFIRQEDLLIRVTLPADIHIVSFPQTALIQIADSLASASLLSPAPQTDQRIQGISLFYTMPVKGTGLIRGMNVTAYIPLGPESKGLIVPRSAIVWRDGNAWVYVEEEKGKFVRHEIQTDNPVEKGFFVSKGIMPGDRLVTKGAQSLLSEEFRTMIQVGEEGEKK